MTTAKQRMDRLTQLGKDPAVVKSAITTTEDPQIALAGDERDTDLVPTTPTTGEVAVAGRDYPSWVNRLDQQVSALVALARTGNTVAINLLADLQAKVAAVTDQASRVAQVSGWTGPASNGQQAEGQATP